MNIETGWRLNSADFSIQATGHDCNGWVQLVRDPESKKLWHKLPEHLQDDVPLYVTGNGKTLEDAIISANNMAAAHAAPIPEKDTNPWREIVKGEWPECKPDSEIILKYHDGATRKLLAGDILWNSIAATHWRYGEYKQ